MFYKGKYTCKILKEIRRQIAEENDINLVIEECTYKGDCLGTCPRCEAEVKYLEDQLASRKKAGKALKVAGISAAMISMLAPSCAPSQKKPADPIQLEGDVEMLEGLVEKLPEENEGEGNGTPTTDGVEAIDTNTVLIGKVAEPIEPKKKPKKTTPKENSEGKDPEVLQGAIKEPLMGDVVAPVRGMPPVRDVEVDNDSLPSESTNKEGE